MSDSKIRKAFNDIVRGYATSKGYPVALENGVFTPPATGPYLKTQLFPAKTGSSTLAGDHKSYIGVYQVTIAVPAGEGTGNVTTIIDELQALFPLYQRVAYGSNIAVVMSPVSPMTAITQDGYFYTPTFFNYRSDTN